MAQRNVEIDNLVPLEFAALAGLSVVESDFERLYRERLKRKDFARKKEKYNSQTAYVIQALYMIAAVIWLAVIYWTGLYQILDSIIIVLIAIPIIIFLIGYATAFQVTVEVEDTVLTANYLSFAFLIMVVIINWKVDIPNEKKKLFFSLVVTIARYLFTVL